MKLLYTFILFLAGSHAFAAGCTAPTITSNPSNKAVCENSTTYFRVLATGPSLTYQWQINQGSGFTNVINTPPFSGATSDSLIITTVPVSLDNSIYRCIVSNGCMPNDTSSNALLKITGASSILTQPSNLTGCLGGSNSFSVVAAGTGLTYQWQVNSGSGFVNVPAGLPYSGDTTATLTINPTPLSFNGYQYQCVINATCSSTLTSNPVTLTLSFPPTITAQPASVSGCDGDAIPVSLSATGAGLTFQWQINTGSGYSNLSNTSPHSGVTTSTLNINPVSFSMNGFSYRCIVSGTCSPADTSAGIPLTVYQTYSNFTNATICQGDTLVFGSSNLTAPGFYSNTFSSINSCDSTVFLSLNVNMAYFTTTASTICSNDSVLLGSTYASAPGVYTYIVPTVAGCDSTIEHTLSNYASYLFASTSVVCDGDSVLIFGTYEKLDSIYSEQYLTFEGCDSIYTHELIINPNYDYGMTINICQGDSVLIGGVYQSTSGVYTFNYSTFAGCDSTVATTLNVNPIYNFTQNISICAGDSVYLEGAYQNTSGVYTDSLSTVSDCDSVMVTTLTVGALPFVSLDLSVIPGPICAFNAPLTLAGGSPAGGTYSGPGVTSTDTFEPMLVGAGLYELTYTYADSAGCSASVVDSILVEVCGGVREALMSSDFSFYPNPFSNEFSITSESNEMLGLSVYNVLGESVYTQQLSKGKTFITLNQPAGVYFAEISLGDDKIVRKLIKK